MQKTLIVLGLLCVSTIAFAQRPPVPQAWAATNGRLSMEDVGWDFRASFSVPEHKCYGLPPHKKWPPGDWTDQAVRDAAVKAGAVRFSPRNDGKCYAEDAVAK